MNQIIRAKRFKAVIELNELFILIQSKNINHGRRPRPSCSSSDISLQVLQVVDNLCKKGLTKTMYDVDF
jgi:hypothetical protein